MDLHLITSDPQLQAVLIQKIQAQPLAQRWRLASTTCRLPQQALAPLLRPIRDGLLLLENDVHAQGTDWEALAHLTAHRPRLNVVVMSHDASKEQLLAAMRAGVREVIACPPDDRTFQSTLHRWSSPQVDMSNKGSVSARPQGQLIAFMACKGGAGSTFLATGLAHIMATEFDRSCAFIDLDLLYGDATFYLGQTTQPNTIADLATPSQRLDSLLLASCMYMVAPGLQMLSAPADMSAATALQTNHIDKVLSLTSAAHPWVVVDLPRSLEPRCMTALTQADVIYLVMDSTMAALRDAQRCLQHLQAQGCDVHRIRLVVNKHSREAALPAQTVQAALGMPVRHQVPKHDEAVNECINLGQPLAQLHPHNPVAQALRQMAADLLQMPAPNTSGRLFTRLGHWLSRSYGRRPSTSTIAGASLETHQP